MPSGLRIQTPDLLKGVAVVLMIQVHVMELFARQEIMDGSWGKISLFLGGVPAAPVFMIIMGYFAALGNKPPGSLVRRGLRLFAAGLLLNIGLNAHLIWKVLFDGWGAVVNVWTYIFGVDILHLAGLSLMITGVFYHLFHSRVLPWLLLLSLVLVIPFVTTPYHGEIIWLRYPLAFIYSSEAWSYFPLIPWLAYPAAGYLFRLIESVYLTKGISPLRRNLLLLVLPVFIVIGFTYAVKTSHSLEAYYHHDILFFLWALVFMTWWWALASFAQQHMGSTRILKFIKWLGIHVTRVYIVQWLLIGNIATGIYKSLPEYLLVISFVLMLIFTSLFTLLWNRATIRYPIKFLTL